MLVVLTWRLKAKAMRSAEMSDLNKIFSAAGVQGGADAIDFSKLAHRSDEADAPKVYFTREITPKGLLNAYEALGRVPTGKVACKLSSGEAGNKHYLQPALIKDLVQKLEGTIVECNTAYQGARCQSADHWRVINEHGFTAIAPFDLMDEEGEMKIPVKHGKYLQYDIVGDHLSRYDFMVVLSHAKGHAMGGFGGALKNISIGVASTHGKGLIHTAGRSEEFGGFATVANGAFLSNDSPEHNQFIESMAEAASAVYDYFDHGKRMLFISVVNNLSVDCDCDGNAAPPCMRDIGILASLDPVAIDQAFIDLVNLAPDNAPMLERIHSRNGTLILDRAKELGVGKKRYQWVDLDR